MRRLPNPAYWDYKSASAAIETINVLAILVCCALLAGGALWAIKFIAHPTARTLLRVFVGLCLAAIVTFVCLVWGVPTSLLVSGG